MNGAHFILKTLADAGMDTLFTNPGTSEMQMVAALDEEPRVRAVLGLFEGVCTGAADGYWRATGRPAVCLLHLGPGLANGLANLHNARRAGSGILTIVGDHARAHQPLDAPLSSDIEGLARPMSDLVIRTSRIGDLGSDLRLAHKVAARGQVVTLILAADIAWAVEGSFDDPIHPELPDPGTPALPDASEVEDALSQAGDGTMVLVGGDALATSEARAALEAIRQKTGCRIACPTFNARSWRGAGLPPVERTPYIPEMAVPFFASVSRLVLIGATVPVGFFAYPGKPSTFLPEECEVVDLSVPGVSSGALAVHVAERLGAVPQPIAAADPESSAAPTGALSPASIGRSLARHTLEGGIIVDEAITAGMPLYEAMSGAVRHHWCDLTGGSIGMGLPLATGLSVGTGGGPVVCLTGDGSALYTAQALWTQARERLPVVTVVLNNGAYQILRIEMLRTGANAIGPRAEGVLNLGDPAISFAGMAAAMGVHAVCVDTAEAFDQAFAAAIASPDGPTLIEAMVP